MKIQCQRIFVLSAAMLCLLTAGYLPAYSVPASTAIADKPSSQPSDGSMDPQSDPFPICPTCVPSPSGN